MSVIFCGLESIEGSFEGESGERNQQLVFKAQTNEPPYVVGDAAVTRAVVFATGLDVGSRYPFDVESLCSRVSTRLNTRHIKPDQTVWDWQVTYTFKTGTGDKNTPPSNEKDKTQRPPRITATTKVIEVPVTGRDKAGKRVENSAGDPFVRTKKTGVIMWRWERHMPTWNWQWNLPEPAGFLFSRNLNAWTPAGPYTKLFGGAVVQPGQAQMQSITSDAVFGGGDCVLVSVEIATDPNAFADILLDQGLYFLNTPGVYTPAAGEAPATMRRRFVDRHGVATGPQLLNGAGSPLAVGADPVQLSFQYYGQRDWDSPPWGPATGPGSAGHFFGKTG